MKIVLCHFSSSFILLENMKFIKKMEFIVRMKLFKKMNSYTQRFRDSKVMSIMNKVEEYIDKYRRVLCWMYFMSNMLYLLFFLIYLLYCQSTRIPSPSTFYTNFTFADKKENMAMVWKQWKKIRKTNPFNQFCFRLNIRTGLAQRGFAHIVWPVIYIYHCELTINYGFYLINSVQFYSISLGSKEVHWLHHKGTLDQTMLLQFYVFALYYNN